MYLSHLLNKNEPSISFEIFPPKNTTSIESIYKTIDGLAPLEPDFISVTYGAGGSSQSNTLEIAKVVQQEYKVPVLTHLTCVGSTKDKIDAFLAKLDEANIYNILALRGDLPKDAKLGDMHYASELVEYIKKQGKFDLFGACYPEKHVEAKSLEEDLEHLKYKVEMGTKGLISQLFFDNQVFYKWRDLARQRGIEVPIIAGIMPITTARQLARIVSLCGATIPPQIQILIKAYHHNEAALKEAGIIYATQQIVDLLATGVDGIHIYTMNQPDIAQSILSNIRSITYSLKKKKY